MQAANKSASPDATTNIPATRITQAFEQARQQGRGAFLPYFMCGYPSAAQSVKLTLAAIEAGADIVELGMPFSDPLADGPTIQRAGHAALQGGMTINGCMEVAGQVAAQSTAPLLLMGYYNPILAYGIERFCATARTHGVCGLIIPDLPPEEATPLLAAAQRHGLSLIFLIPPTTPDARIAMITDLAASETGAFIYCVSLSGVTGARKELPPQLRSFVARIRNYTAPKGLPLVVGIGLSLPEHIAEVTTFADGAVVGSALVNLIDRHEESEQVAAVKAYVQSMCKR